MELDLLFNGIAVVIDDEIGKEGASINDLIRKLNELKMPCFTSRHLLEMDSIRHLGSASFLILDWKLVHDELKEETVEGIKIPATLGDSAISENIEFLQSLIDKFFSPVFIFTDENKETVIDTLRENGLYQDDKPNIIFVKNKSEIIGEDELFTTIENWLKENPSIYVLKKWEHEYQNAKNLMFKDFYNRSVIWPEVLWKSYERDKVDASKELVEVIMKNVNSRMEPFEFDSSFLETGIMFNQHTELRNVIEGERYIKAEQLKPEDVSTGDIFRIDNIHWPYLINIRAQCDLRNNPELYCLKGRVIEESQINAENGIPFKEGEFREKKYQAIVSCIDGGKIIEFSFRSLIIHKWNSIKNNRIGRLLPPYITRIQQLYSLYFQRIGLPRTPDEILCIDTEQESEANTVAATAEKVAATKEI